MLFRLELVVVYELNHTIFVNGSLYILAMEVCTSEPHHFCQWKFVRLG
jgi:hypothetical protein